VRLIATEHASHRTAGWRETAEFEAPDAKARILDIRWPDDPLSQPVRVIWLVSETRTADA
jgi:hypothetical protein